MKLLDWIIGREPVATATGIAAVVTAGLGVAAAFGLDITAEQIAAVGALAAALAGWAGRRAVTPVTTPYLRRLDRAGPPPPEFQGGTFESGSIPLAFIILAAVIFLILAGVFVSCDALFNDEDEPGDLGAPALVLDHDCYDCDDWGGGSDGNRGYDGEGGRSGDYDGGPGDDCRNLCGNTVIIPDPRQEQATPSPSRSSFEL